jgi:lipid-A-disaccharide synthase
LPAVIIYKGAPVDYWIARRITAVRWAGLPSLLAGREVMPEVLQTQLTPRRLAGVVGRWLADPAGRARLRDDLLALRSRLGAPAVAERAAREILGYARLLEVEAAGTIQTN